MVEEDEGADHPPLHERQDAAHLESAEAAAACRDHQVHRYLPIAPPLLKAYAASTSTISESASALTFSTGTSAIAAPSRASMRTPLTSTAPDAGTK